MRIGILADIHGNSLALDAVLEHGAGRRVERWLNAGDCVYGPLDPGGTARRLRALDALTVCGNQDRILVEPPEILDATHTFVRGELSGGDLEWIAALPKIAEWRKIFLCHGSPQDDEEPLVERIHAHGVDLRESAAIEADLSGLDAEIVICGHTHVPRLVSLDGRLVLNPGSVGLPAYTDDAPYPHAMEAGSPHARYAILEEGANGWAIEQLAVPYDWRAAAQQAEKLGRLDWASSLLTGRASFI